MSAKEPAGAATDNPLTHMGYSSSPFAVIDGLGGLLKNTDICSQGWLLPVWRIFAGASRHGTASPKTRNSGDSHEF